MSKKTKQKRNYTPFSEAEDEIIKADNKILSLKQTAEKLGRSESAVYKRRKQLGLTEPNRLTDQEKEFILNNFMHMEYKDIAKAIGRNKKCVSKFLSKLNITKKHIWQTDEINDICSAKTRRDIYDLAKKYNVSVVAIRSVRYKNGHEKINHGMSKTRLYHTWKDMRARCNCESKGDYKWYGGKGVSVCEEWNDFKVFYEWAINNGYNDTLTIERIDFNGNYCPENCSWITAKEQKLNTSQNVRIAAWEETKTIKEWSEDCRCAVSYGCLRGRLTNKKHWTNEERISIPNRGRLMCQ